MVTVIAQIVTLVKKACVDQFVKLIMIVLSMKNVSKKAAYVSKILFTLKKLCLFAVT